MFDLGWMEIGFIVVLALIVVGPKDLPKLIRSISSAMTKARKFYRDGVTSMHKLEQEIDIASGKYDSDGEPNIYELLPDHIKKSMISVEPSRDKASNEAAQKAYEDAVAELKEKMEPAQRSSEDDSKASSVV
ncbi:MAG: hypothetical protein WCY88_15120 [Spongiibacteraceae bacterium]